VLVKVRTFANLRDVVGSAEIEYELHQGNTLGCLLESMCQKYGTSFEHQIKDHATGVLVPFLVLINEKTYRSVADLETPLNESDIITIMLPFDGG
jgi:MoaD family protein